MQTGFSLIELIVVLAIVGIMTCFAYPSYQHQITMAHRMDGQTALLDLANRMEQYYASHNTYEKSTIATRLTSDVLSQSKSPEGWYTLTITTATANTFSLQAIANQTQAEHDPNCRVLTFNHLGVRGSISNHEDAKCW